MPPTIADAPHRAVKPAASRADDRPMQRRASRAGEAGFSLVEVMVVLLLLSFILGAIITSALTAESLGARNQESAQAVRDAQVAVQAMTRELRQAVRIMPTGSSAGMCPSTSTAGCVDFLVRSRTIDPATSNHYVRRVRLDCTVAYAAAGDPSAAQYRSCARYVGGEVLDPAVAAPATTLTGVLIPRILNWTTGTCAAIDPTFTCPVFGYRKSDPTSATGWVAASASTDTASSDAERINVTLQVPSRGESWARGAKRNLLVQDGAQLRNVLRG